MELVTEFLFEEVLILIPALLIIGKVLKETPNFKDWLIPHTLLVLGVILSVFMMGFEVDSVVQGILVSGTAVFGHELYKQSVERDEW